MGMFSWDCNGCGFSLRECRGCSVDNWMSRGVCLTPDGSRVIGYYNAYGQLGEYNLVDQIGKFAIYHHACWEVAGKPEYDRPSHHSRDQGFCHAMHGTPFPKPTGPEWFVQAKTWQIFRALFEAYGSLLCDLDYAREEGYWKMLTPERQLVVCNEYRTARAARKERDKVAWEAYLRSAIDDENGPPVPEPDPTHYKFDGINFDYMWLGHFIDMAKTRS